MIGQTKNKFLDIKEDSSFLPNHKLFRIDLTVVKSSEIINRQMIYSKTFRDANILSQNETI